jgi:hypothetical protein
MPRATSRESTMSFEWGWLRGNSRGTFARERSLPLVEAQDTMSSKLGWLGRKLGGEYARKHSLPPVEAPGRLPGCSHPRPYVRSRRSIRSWAAEEVPPSVAEADPLHSDARTERPIHFSVSRGAVRSLAEADPPPSDGRTWRPILLHRACLGIIICTCTLSKAIR